MPTENRDIGSPRSEFVDNVNHLTLVLGTELRARGRAVHMLLSSVPSLKP